MHQGAWKCFWRITYIDSLSECGPKFHERRRLGLKSQICHRSNYSDEHRERAGGQLLQCWLKRASGLFGRAAQVAL